MSSMRAGAVAPQRPFHALRGILPLIAIVALVMSLFAGIPAEGALARDPVRQLLASDGLMSDTTTTNFSAGTSSGTYVSQIADGEVILNPSVGEEFNGTNVPAGWTFAGYGGTPAVPVGGGQITVADAKVAGPGTYGAGSSAEVVATFRTNNPYQGIYFHSDPGFSSPPWIGFDLAGGGTQLQATDPSGQTQLPSVTLGVPHLFRIVWQPTSVTYFVDGAQVARHNTVISAAMKFYLADYALGSGAPLTADWVHLSPYATPGTFTSRVFDSGGTATWQDMTWTADLPTGTALDMSVRSGDTAAPDGTWSAFAPVAESGTVLGLQSRYLQYRAALSTSDPLLTPVLRDVTIAYSAVDNVPPTIVSRSPAAGADHVALNTSVQVGFSEPLACDTVSSSTMRLQVQGGGDVPATVSCAAASVTLLPGQALEPGTTYTVTVSGTVTDTAGNPLGSDASWAFTTALRSRRDTTAANFGAGTSSGTYVSQVADGEVILSPSLGEEFNGTSAPAGWTVTGYGGSPAVSAGGGQITLDSAAVGTPVPATPASRPSSWPRSVRPTPTRAPSSTATRASTRHPTPGSTSRCREPSSGRPTASRTPRATRPCWPRSPWACRTCSASSGGRASVTYFVDGAQLAQHSIAIGVPMRFYLADYGGGPGAPLTADWVHLSPYAAPAPSPRASSTRVARPPGRT